MFGCNFTFSPDTELFSLIALTVHWYSFGGFDRFMTSIVKAEKKNYIPYASYSFNKSLSMVFAINSVCNENSCSSFFFTFFSHFLYGSVQFFPNML